MLDSLKKCRSNVEHNRQILEGTRYMGDHLEGKFAPYTSFVRHSALLYGVIRRMSVLYPCYYLPFYKYVELFSAVIRSRDRGKGSLGMLVSFVIVWEKSVEIINVKLLMTIIWQSSLMHIFVFYNVVIQNISLISN